MSDKSNSTKLHKILTIVGWVLCVILVPILIINCTLLIKSFVNKDDVPDFGGMIPFIVLTDSMFPDIEKGDLIICKTIKPEDVEVGDVISFYDPAGNGTSVVTHKIVEIMEEDGKLFFRTRGINNNDNDKMPVPADKIIAEYSGFRIPGAGHAAIFMQSTTGLIICVVLPIVLFVGYDIIRRRVYEKGKVDDVAALKAELEALKKMQSEANSGTTPVETPVDTPVEEVKNEEKVIDEAPTGEATDVEAPIGEASIGEASADEADEKQSEQG